MESAKCVHCENLLEGWEVGPYCSRLCQVHAAEEAKLEGVGYPPVATGLDAYVGGTSELPPPPYSSGAPPLVPAPVPAPSVGAKLAPELLPVLPIDSDTRKEIPLFSGCLNYFPLALAAVARVSKRGNDKHNPGQPIHWARGKSMDHCDCIARHLIDVETIDGATGEYEDAQALAWRALAKLQELEEARLGKPYSRGSSLDRKENNR